MKLVVTGGAGFIGSAVVRRAIGLGHSVINVDNLSYSGCLANLEEVEGHSNYVFERISVCSAEGIQSVFERHQPDKVLHLAAESHVDRSIDGPLAFVDTNVMGTAVLLEVARKYWMGLLPARREEFRFHHVSTDEVFGSLGPDGHFDEATPYDPSSPYSASKAASDHLVRAWHRTYGLPTLITNCSNNYGPHQFPEKLIPVVVLRALEGKSIPVYGNGKNVRDWLHVDDHASALLAALDKGVPGRTYCVGGDAELSNIDLVRLICTLMDEFRPSGAPHERLITFVADRPGHDQRYAIDSDRVRRELGWTPTHSLTEGLRATVQWYLDHEVWWSVLRARGGVGVRLGLNGAGS